MNTTTDKEVQGLLHEAADSHAFSSAAVNRRLTALEGRMTNVESGVTENTVITTSISSDTTELLDLFKSVKGGFKVMGWLGQFAKWFAGLTAMFAALFAIVQNIRGYK